jgi:hypothetical protein
MIRPLSSVFMALLVAGAGLWPVSPARAQEAEAPRRGSAGKAFALSLVLPGLGHRYAHGGDWDGSASVFVAAEAAFWLGLAGSQWQHAQAVQSYEAFAAERAGAQVEGKERRFFLNLAQYASSDAYVEEQLRNRNWDQLGYVEDPGYRWAWASEEDRERFRALRDDADGVRRRRTLFASALVANRLLAALTSIRAARRANRAAPALLLSVAPPPRSADLPVLNLQVQW